MHGLYSECIIHWHQVCVWVCSELLQFYFCSPLRSTVLTLNVLMGWRRWWSQTHGNAVTKSHVCQLEDGDHGHHGVEYGAVKQMVIPMMSVNQCLQMIPVKLNGGYWDPLWYLNHCLSHVERMECSINVVQPVSLHPHNIDCIILIMTTCFKDKSGLITH